MRKMTGALICLIWAINSVAITPGKRLILGRILDCRCCTIIWENSFMIGVFAMMRSRMDLGPQVNSPRTCSISCFRFAAIGLRTFSYSQTRVVVVPVYASWTVLQIPKSLLFRWTATSLWISKLKSTLAAIRSKLSTAGGGVVSNASSCGNKFALVSQPSRRGSGCSSKILVSFRAFVERTRTIGDGSMDWTISGWWRL